MARSRVGGSSAKLSGKVGDVIYSITRNPDGTFRQSVAAAPDERFNPNTDAQARARLTMATIERAMFTYRDMMGTGFEDVDPGTNSVSKFSELNYNSIKAQLENAWDNNLTHQVRVDLPTKGSTVPRDGEFIISRGSLRPLTGFTGSLATGNHVWFEVKMVELLNYTTLKEVLWNTRLYIGDQAAGFQFGVGSSPSKSFLVWWTMYTNHELRPDTQITPDNWRKILQFNSNVPFQTIYRESDKGIYFVTTDLKPYGLANWGCRGYRRKALKNGKVCYSDQTMEIRWQDPWSRQGWNDVPDVKQSWLSI